MPPLTAEPEPVPTLAYACMVAIRMPLSLLYPEGHGQRIHSVELCIGVCSWPSPAIISSRTNLERTTPAGRGLMARDLVRVNGHLWVLLPLREHVRKQRSDSLNLILIFFFYPDPASKWGGRMQNSLFSAQHIPVVKPVVITLHMQRPAGADIFLLRLLQLSPVQTHGWEPHLERAMHGGDPSRRMMRVATNRKRGHTAAIALCPLCRDALLCSGVESEPHRPAGEERRS